MLRFDGRLRDSFAEYARHRAARLALGILAPGPEQARVSVRGPSDLLDAVEMALSLGPGDCLMLEVTREDNGPKRP